MQTPERKLENGTELPFLGGIRLLTVIREERSYARVNCVKDRLILSLPYDADYACKRNALENWYRREASGIIAGKAEAYAKLLGVRFEKIRIKDQKSCWGSCSGKKNLNFNWRLMMAPEPILDYVVIHELCHLRHMNHSRQFWELVSGLCPDYKLKRKWLKEHEESLYLI